MKTIGRLPENLADEHRRTYFIAFYGGILSGLAHAINLMIFAFHSVTPLAYMNIGSVCLFTIAVLVVRLKGWAELSLVLMSIELIVHQVFAVYFLGWDYGFQYFFFVIPSFVFLGYFKFRFIPLIIAAISTAAFVCSLVWGQSLLDQHYTGIQHLQEIYFWNNLIGSFFGLAMVSYIYSTSATRIEKELARQNLELLKTQVKLVQTEKTAAIGKLAAGVTHEINNPIGVILSSTQTGSAALKKMAKLDVDSDQENRENKIGSNIISVLGQSLSSTTTAAERLQELVARLKEFARVDEAEEKETNLHDGLESVLSLLDEQIFHKSIKINREYSEALPAVYCRPADINQVFMNLLQNAVEAVKEKTGEITITTSSGKSSVHITIQDNGRGMTPLQVEKLFDVGFSSDSSRVKMGIGLPVSYMIINQHNGSITVKSEKNKGSEFSITLPVTS